MVSSTVEDYLKAVLKIEDMNQHASTSNVARHLDVSDAAVTDMLRKLQKAGLLEYKPYYGATLTPLGRLAALKIVRRHRLIELFLQQIMDYGREQVHDEAEKLEHVVSDFFVGRLDTILDHPVEDPHGKVIPNAEGFCPAEHDLCLADASEGNYLVRRVTHDDPQFLAYIERQKLVPGARLVLMEKAPFEGPFKLSVAGIRDPLYLGVEAARSVLVHPVDLSCREAGSNSSTPRRGRQAAKRKRTRGRSSAGSRT
ncbi:MAG: metal-dependent transcriptional regulator [Acidobacteria bacterium]|nr:metal-dependent transcriptional regulator [Acidobacteriota bacterium]MCI0721874.1 metal-dependent transcriptional regulator [Acidobacteriota bacterium]